MPRKPTEARAALSGLDDRELVWLLAILKDACRERLEKNLISQAIEDNLHAHRGAVAGRIDPRPKLKEWEPRYRKFLEIATLLYEQAETAGVKDVALALRNRLVKK